MTLVLEPSTGSGDVIGGTLSSNTHQTGQLRKLTTARGEVGAKGLEDFETSGRRRDGNLGRRFRLGRGTGSIREVAGGVACRRETVTRGRRELESAVRGRDRVRHGVKVQITRESHGCNNLGGGEEVHSFEVTIVSSLKVSVERSQNRIVLPLLLISLPLTNTRSTGVGKDSRADIFQSALETIPFNSGSDEFGTGGDEEGNLGLESGSLGLFGDGGDSGHVFVRRVGT